MDIKRKQNEQYFLLIQKEIKLNETNKALLQGMHKDLDIIYNVLNNFEKKDNNLLSIIIDEYNYIFINMSIITIPVELITVHVKNRLVFLKKIPE